MRQWEQTLVRQISQLEKQIGNRGDKSELLERAMAEVYQEATAEELRTASGSGKLGRCPAPEEMFAMHELFKNRAEEKVKKSNDEKGKQL